MNKCNTIQYYNKNAIQFSDTTKDLSFQKNQNRFLNYLKKGDTILDFGCGAGRDTKYFLEQGFQVVAVDGSEELCRLASEHIGITVKRMLFQELDDLDTYPGIWACASILHVPKNELTEVFEKMSKALKQSGVIYASFKYGTYEGERSARYFTDFTEETFGEFLVQISGLSIEEVWMTTDVRPDRGDEKWLNIILRKI